MVEKAALESKIELEKKMKEHGSNLSNDQGKLSRLQQVHIICSEQIALAEMYLVFLLKFWSNLLGDEFPTINGFTEVQDQEVQVDASPLLPAAIVQKKETFLHIKEFMEEHEASDKMLEDATHEYEEQVKRFQAAQDYKELLEQAVGGNEEGSWISLYRLIGSMQEGLDAKLACFSTTYDLLEMMKKIEGKQGNPSDIAEVDNSELENMHIIDLLKKVTDEGGKLQSLASLYKEMKKAVERTEKEIGELQEKEYDDNEYESCMAGVTIAYECEARKIRKVRKIVDKWLVLLQKEQDLNTKSVKKDPRQAIVDFLDENRADSNFQVFRAMFEIERQGKDTPASGGQQDE